VYDSLGQVISGKKYWADGTPVAGQQFEYTFDDIGNRLTEKRRAEESAAGYEQLRRDWVLGSEEFRQELLAAAVGRVGPSHYGAERQETAVQMAERLVREELERMGWSEEQLRGRPKGHPGKVAIARRLRQETIMSLKWIAQRLEMGTWTYVSNLLNARVTASPNQEVLPLCQS
jgi:hypothetical protein